MTVKVTGTKEVQRAIQKRMRKLKKNVGDAVIKTALQTERSAVQKTPVDTGALRSSSYVVSWKGGTAGPTADQSVISQNSLQVKSTQNKTAIIGFTMKYSFSVHENPKSGRTGRPGAASSGEAFFLLKALNENVTNYKKNLQQVKI
jgi:hypothetical protein